MKKLLLAAIAVAIAVMAVRWARGDSPLSLVTAEVRNPYPPSSPLYAASQEFVDGINQDPKLRSRFSGVFTRRGLYADVTTALRRGARSLDGPVLVGATQRLPARCRTWTRTPAPRRSANTTPSTPSAARRCGRRSRTSRRRTMRT